MSSKGYPTNGWDVSSIEHESTRKSPENAGEKIDFAGLFEDAPFHKMRIPRS